VSLTVLLIDLVFAFVLVLYLRLYYCVNLLLYRFSVNKDLYNITYSFNHNTVKPRVYMRIKQYVSLAILKLMNITVQRSNGQLIERYGWKVVSRLMQRISRIDRFVFAVEVKSLSTPEGNGLMSLLFSLYLSFFLAWMRALCMKPAYVATFLSNGFVECCCKCSAEVYCP